MMVRLLEVDGTRYRDTPPIGQPHRNELLSMVHGSKTMNATIVGAFATAGLLGITHAIEPDHVAGIASLTSEYSDSRLSALAGACFSVGHVVLVVVWLAVAYVLLGQTEFPAVFDIIGTVGVGVFLGLLGTAMAVGGLTRIISTEGHDHGQVSHGHSHIYLPLPGFDSHDHDAISYLKTGLVGALFTLSPPVSMIVFSSTLLPNYGADVVGLTVVTYGITITVTMSLLGASAGMLSELIYEQGRRFHGIAQIVVGSAIVALAMSLFFDITGALLQ